jgi:hypothetical protein
VSSLSVFDVVAANENTSAAIMATVLFQVHQTSNIIKHSHKNISFISGQRYRAAIAHLYRATFSFIVDFKEVKIDQV